MRRGSAAWACQDQPERLERDVQHCGGARQSAVSVDGAQLLLGAAGAAGASVLTPLVAAGAPIFTSLVAAYAPLVTPLHSNRLRLGI